MSVLLERRNVLRLDRFAVQSLFTDTFKLNTEVANLRKILAEKIPTFSSFLIQFLQEVPG